MKKIEDLTEIISQGITAQDVIDTVKKTGFPLQTKVANYLSNKFYVQEEWAFTDADSQETRTLDIFAQKNFWESEKIQPHARPELNLLMECKKSESPYVFFLSRNHPYTADFPIISGLRKDDISLKTDDDLSTHIYPVVHALGLESHPFLSDKVPCAMTFSKCTHIGNKIQLDGDDTFRSLLLPLVKGMRYFKEAAKPPITAMYYDCGITLGVAVIDAPLLGVSSEDNSIEHLEWVRIFRRTSEDAESNHERFKCFAFDVVHKDFLDTYINKHLFPFMEIFSSLVIKHQKEIITGRGFASGLGKGVFDIEASLKPR